MMHAAWHSGDSLRVHRWKEAHERHGCSAGSEFGRCGVKPFFYFFILMLSLSNSCDAGETFVLSPALRAPEGLKHLQRKTTTSWQPHSVHFTFHVNDLVVLLVNLEPSCTEH